MNPALKEKILSPAKEEAERMVAEARLQADRIILDAKKDAILSIYSAFCGT